MVFRKVLCKKLGNSGLTTMPLTSPAVPLSRCPDSVPILCRFCVTVSIGIAAVNATDTTADQTLARADKALYRAKAAGRNRIELAGELTGKIDSTRHQGAKA